MLLAFVVAMPALALRPQLFGVVLFIATLVVLIERAEHPRRLWLIPVFAALWANLHGSFPLVIVLMVGMFDLAFAVRVGALDGRHPELEARARQRIADALTPHGRLFIDGGDPLREIRLR